MGRLLDSLDISNFVPELGTMLSVFWIALVLAVMTTPVLLLVKGYFCFFEAPQDKKNRWAFQTFYCKKSDEVWYFTQKISGLVLGALGAVLALVMLIVCIVCGIQGLEVLARAAVTCLIWELALTVLGYVAVMITVAVMFDRNGQQRA